MLTKVVFDTNIFISAVIFGGNPRRCLELARSGEINLSVSNSILLELAEKLYIKFGWNQNDVEKVIIGVSKFSNIVLPKDKVTKIKLDDDDNRILEVVKEINADYLISGDKKHILSLKKFGKTTILSATDFLRIFPKLK